MPDGLIELTPEQQRELLEMLLGAPAMTTEWGVTYYIDGDHAYLPVSRPEAREALAQMRRMHPACKPILCRRRPIIPAGEWIEVPGDEA